LIGPTRKGVPKVVSALVPVFSGSRVASMSPLSAAAPHHDGLEILRAQHGADAAPPRDALAILPIVGHRGEAHAVLTRRADGDRVRVGALGGGQRVHRLARRPAPDVGRGLHLGARLGHREIGRRRRAATDQHGVEARALERRREAPAERRIEKEAGQRRLGGDAGPAVAGHRRVGDGPYAEDDRVVGRERVGPRRDAVVEQARGEAVSAHERPCGAFVERLDARRPRR
jgi:hypothetical protein